MYTSRSYWDSSDDHSVVGVRLVKYNALSKSVVKSIVMAAGLTPSHPNHSRQSPF